MVRTYRLAELSWGNAVMKFSNKENDPQAEHYLTLLKGWHDGVGVRGEDQARMGHGEFESRNYRGSRTIVIEATLVYPTEDARDEADDFVASVLWDGKPGILTVTQGSRKLHTSVKIDGPIGHTYIGSKAMSVQINLKSSDPFRYGETRISQVFPAGFGEGLEYNLFSESGILTYGNSVAESKVAVTNYGTADAFPKFTVRGDFPSGVVLTDGRGNTIELPVAIYSESPVTIDMGGSVLINGFDQSSSLTRRDWFTVAPGETIQPRVSAIQPGNGWVDIEIQDTYI